MNSYFDLKFNLLGIFFASVGVFVTSLYQVVCLHPFFSYYNCAPMSIPYLFGPSYTNY